MLIDNGNNTYTCGRADIICILELPAHTYHVAFFEESPLPGGGDIETLDVLRLKSKMHHTTGSTTLEGAQKHLDDMRTKLITPDDNVLRDRAVKVMEPINVWILPNWIKEHKTISAVL